MCPWLLKGPGFRGQWSVHLGQNEMLVCPAFSDFLEDLVNSFPPKHIQISLLYLRSLRECLLLIPEAVGGEGYSLPSPQLRTAEKGAEKMTWPGPWSEVPLSGTSHDPDPRVVPRFD